MRILREPDSPRPSIVVFVCLLLSIFGGCDESDDIIVNTVADNEPPLIARQGPDFPSETLELDRGSGAPEPWVLVGDPNGLDDISAVLFSVQSIRIHELIIRPDAMDGGCANVLFEPGNAVDTTSVVPVPVDISGVTDEPMAHDEGGIYRVSPFGVPPIAGHFDTLGSPSGCATGGGYLQWLLLLPPAAPATTSVFLTYLDVEFIGISVTVYDKVGANASITFPDLRVVYTTAEEKAVAP